MVMTFKKSVLHSQQLSLYVITDRNICQNNKTKTQAVINFNFFQLDDTQSSVL